MASIICPTCSATLTRPKVLQSDAEPFCGRCGQCFRSDLPEAPAPASGPAPPDWIENEDGLTILQLRLLTAFALIVISIGIGIALYGPPMQRATGPIFVVLSSVVLLYCLYVYFFEHAARVIRRREIPGSIRFYPLEENDRRLLAPIGFPDAIYRGSTKHALSHTRVGLLLMTLGAAGAWVLLNGVWNIKILLGTPASLLVGLVYAFQGLYRARNPLTVLLCPKGLVYHNGQTHLGIAWSRIVALFEDRRKGHHDCTLVLDDASRLPIAFGQLTNYRFFVNRLKKALRDQRLAAKLDSMANGQDISFGPLTINLDGLGHAHRSIGWDEIKSVQIDADFDLVVLKRGVLMAWCSISAHTVPDLYLLLSLIEEHLPDTDFSGLDFIPLHGASPHVM